MFLGLYGILLVTNNTLSYCSRYCEFLFDREIFGTYAKKSNTNVVQGVHQKLPYGLQTVYNKVLVIINITFV